MGFDLRAVTELLAEMRRGLPSGDSFCCYGAGGANGIQFHAEVHPLHDVPWDGAPETARHSVAKPRKHILPIARSRLIRRSPHLALPTFLYLWFRGA